MIPSKEALQAAEKYARQEVSEFESVRQHDVVIRAFLSGHSSRDEEVARLKASLIDEWIEFLQLAIKSERSNELSEYGEGAQSARVEFISMLKQEKKGK